MTRFKDLPALSRFSVLGDIHDKAEEMVNNASSFQVDAVVAGIEDFFRDQGVDEGVFLARLRATAEKKKAKQAKNVCAFTRMLPW